MPATLQMTNCINGPNGLQSQSRIPPSSLLTFPIARTILVMYAIGHTYISTTPLCHVLLFPKLAYY